MTDLFRALAPWLLLVLLACGGSRNSGAVHVRVLGPSLPLPPLGSTLELEAVVRKGDDLANPPAGSYQWIFNGSPIPGANQRTLTLASLTREMAGGYAVHVKVDGQDTTTEPYYVEPVDVVLVVTTPADHGPGSLRERLSQVRGDQLHGILLDLPTGQDHIQLASTLIAPVGRAVLLAPSWTSVVVDGADACRPFFVPKGASLALTNFTVTGGLAKGGDGLGGGGAAGGMGGAMFINGGAVALRDMLFVKNRALGGASSPGTDGENGGGGGFGGDSASQGGTGAPGGLLGGTGGFGTLDGLDTSDGDGGDGDGDGAGGGAARGGLLSTPLAQWAANLEGGSGGDFGGGGGFSVGPLGGGGDGSFGSGGGGSGGVSAHFAMAFAFPGAAAGEGGTFGGDGGLGDGIQGGRGGGGGGMGGAIFLRHGSLKADGCNFSLNRAEGGDGAERGLGKGGAVFIYDDENGASEAAAYMAMLGKQRYAGNVATDLVEDPSFDNANFYVAQTLLAKRVDPAFRDLYRRYRLALRMGIPPRGTP
ncbi:immunoglobulin domain-containing family protein [Mesoterricola sediminis]|uniref:Ig-like domain-containing protein n=1 Tax=Mesoterricola sediminis TaxID=2927980 RepID=A0AA48H8H2_9BACT|nr:hypothetical protein [Mesoterricola sediminis]BDU77878.1 hypothetical protein METESE_28360 [Mesoterricola sediminis]